MKAVGSSCVCSLVLASSIGCSGSHGLPEDSREPSVAAALAPDSAMPLPVSADDPSSAKAEVVYESIRLLGKDDTLVSSTEKGTLSRHDWQRAARPWTYRDEPYVYHDQAWQRPTDDGLMEYGYRVYRTPNTAPPRPPS